MAVKFANLASTTLSSAITNSATSIAVADASLFPTLGSGDYFYATIGEGSGSEIVKVTAISSNTLTVTRAQDGTTASAFSSGETIALRVVAAALDDIASQAQSAADTESVSIDGDTMTGALKVSMPHSTTYSDSLTWSEQSYDALKVINGNSTSSADQFSSIFMQASGGGNASARIVLRNDNSGNGRLYFQMRSGAHTGVTQPKMLITDDGYVTISDNANTYNERLFVDGTLRAEDGIKVGATRIVTSARALQNITSISSGAINASGTIKQETAFGGFITLKRSDTTTTNNTDIGVINFEHTDSDDAGVAATILVSGDGDAGGAKMRFYTGTPTTRAERLTINDDGHVTIGTTNTLPGVGNTTTGTSLYNDGRIFASKTGNTTMSLNRNDSDGNLVEFRRQGSIIGSVASRGGAVTTIIFDPRTNGSGITGTTNGVLPTNQAGSPTSNHVDLGSNTNKFRDLYLSGDISSGAITSGSIASSGQIMTTQEAANSLKSRFLMGKAGGSTADGPLYLQYGSADGVYIGSGSGGAGLTVAGTISSGAITSTGNMSLSNTGTGNNITINRTDSSSSAIFHVGSSRGYVGTTTDHVFEIRQNDTPAITIDTSGNTTVENNLVVDGNLTVSGTTTTLNTATLDVEDKNITLNYSTGDSSASANGAGITIQDAVDSTTDATILWDATYDEFGFSHPISVVGNSTFTGSATDTTSAATFRNSANSVILRVRNDGRVLIPSGYLFAQHSDGAYFTGSIKARGGITNDGGNNLSISSGGTDITFNSKNFTSVGTISSGAITSSSTGQFENIGIGIAPSTPGLKVYHTDNYEAAEFITNQGGSLARFTDNTSTSIEIGIQSGVPVIRTGSQARLTVDGSDLKINSGGLKIANTTVIDSSRNLANIGTIGSTGEITVTNGSFNLSSGYNIQWGGSYSSGFPSIFANSSQKVLRFAPNGGTTGTVLEIDSGGLDLKVGGYEINGTTVIDSSRNIFLDPLGTATGSGTQFNSPDIRLYASGWDTNNSVARTVGWKIRNIPTASVYPDHDLHFIEDDQGSQYTKFQLHGRGSTNHTDPRAGTFFGNLHVEAGSGTNAGDGAITSTGNLTARTGTFSGQNGTALTVNSGSTNVAAVFESGDDEVWINLKDNNSGTYGALLGHADDALFKVADNSVNVRMLLSAAGLLDTDSGYSVGGTAVIDTSRNLTNIGTISSGAITSSARSTFSGGLDTNNSQSRVKISPWTGTTYGYGMKSGMTFGGLSNNYALTFQVNSSAGRGFWWGRDEHSDAQGAMALTNDGKLTVSHSLRLGYGISDTTTPGATHALDVSGSISSGAVTSTGLGTFKTLTLTGDSDDLTFTDTGGDWSIKNAQQNNGIVIYDGSGGVEIHYNNAAVAEFDSAGGMNIVSGELRMGGTTRISSSGTGTFGYLNIVNSAMPTLTLYDNGNGGGGAAEAKIEFTNTAGTAVAIGYTDDQSGDTDLIISTNAAGTYGGYLGLTAAAIADAQSDIILEPKTDVRIATGGLKVGTTTVIDSSTNATFKTVTIDPTVNGPALNINRYTGQPNIKAGTDDGGYLIMDSNGGMAALNWYSSDRVVLANGGGNVGIGSSGSHTQKLYIAGDVRATSDIRSDAGYSISGTTVIDSSRNLTNIGTISSGAITSSGKITATELEINSSANSAYLSGNASIATDGYIMATALLNEPETGTNGTGITFGNGSTLGNDQISLITSGQRRLYVDNAGAFDFGNGNVGSVGTISSGAITSSGNLTVKGTQGFNATGETASIYLGDTASEIRATYDGGTKFFLNAVDRMEIEGGTGNLNLKTGNLEINGTTVIDSSRVLQNVTANASIITSGTINNNRLNSDVLITDGGTYSTGFTGDLDTITGFRIHRVTGFTGTDHRAFTGHHNLLQLPNTSSSGPYDVQLAFTTVGSGTPEFKFRSSGTTWSDWVKVFNDGYHPNADKWTTARTLTLTGDVTGSVSIDGSGNVSLATTKISTIPKKDTAENISAHWEWQDNQQVRFGNGADFRIYHNGTNTYLRNYNHSAGNIYFQGENTSGTNQALIYMQNNTARTYVRLFENGGERLKTTSTGVELALGMSIGGSTVFDSARDIQNVQAETGTTGLRFKTGAWFYDSANQARFQFVASSHNYYKTDGNGGKHFFFDGNSTTEASADAFIDAGGNGHFGGNVTAYSSSISSDARLKENIRPIESATETVKQLNGVVFDWKKTERGTDQLGFIAQEIEQVLPSLVTEVDTLKDENTETHKTVNYAALVPMLVESIKELTKRIEELENGDN